MGKSYVLKGKNKQICGFVMQTGRCIRYRVTHFSKKPLTLTVLYSSGKHVRIEIADSDEHQHEGKNDELLGAYAVSEKELIMDTGKAAQDAYCIWQSSLDREKQPAKHQTEDPYQTKESEIDTPFLENERRWPPPPCISDAHYLNGKWVDQSIGV